jgi:hypothetical protein
MKLFHGLLFGPTVILLLVLVSAAITGCVLTVQHAMHTETPKPWCVVGEVTAVGQWGISGDGWLTMIAEMPHARVPCEVRIFGYDHGDKETRLELNHRFVQDLLHHRIEVTGQMYTIRPENGATWYRLDATLIREIELPVPTPLEKSK